MRNVPMDCVRLTVALVLAASSTPAVAAQPAGETRLEEIVVTASKRGEERLADVPLSIQAFTGDAMVAASIRDFSQVITSVPGASEELSGNVGTRRYQIRGIAQGPGDATVGYYFDDAAFFIWGTSYAPVGRAFDLARVEVLRGPQSTLYGNGSMGGTVRFIPNAPNLSDWQANFAAGYSSTEGGDPGHYVDAAVSMPLVKDKLGLRLTGSFEKVGGYQDIPALQLKDVNEADIKSLRANLLFSPTDQFDIKFLYARNEADQDGGTGLASVDPSVAIGQPGDYVDVKWDLYSGTLSYDFESVTLSSTTTYIDYENPSSRSFPFPVPGGLLFIDSNNQGTAFNNETRLSSSADAVLPWIVGLFYSDTEATSDTAYDPALVPASVQQYDSESFSIFGEVSWPLLDGKLIPLVGLRYFEDDRSTKSTSFTTQPDATTFDSVNPRFNLAYRPTETANYYLNVAKGFRSGNFNNPDACALHVALGGLPCEVAVDSDELWSYEVGTKQTLAANQFMLDVAFYYQDWQDAHQFVPFLGLFQDYPVGDAEIYGVDVGLTYTPAAVEGLSFQATANWNNAEWVKLDPVLAAAAGVQEGDRPPFVPEWTFALSMDYSRAVVDDWLGRFSLGYNHIEPQSGQFGTPAVGDKRDLLRARLGIEGERFGAYLFGTNLLNETGAIYSQAPAGGLQIFTQDYPRQVGVEVTLKY